MLNSRPSRNASKISSPGAAACRCVRWSVCGPYKKLGGLYDLSVLVATLDQKRAGAQGRFDVQGLSFDNAQKLTKFYLGAYGRPG